MTNYEKLRSIIQAANPEIMELKFGCELRVNNVGKRRFFVGSNYEEGESYFVDIDQVSREDQIFYTEEYPEDVKKNIILGRTIRLADVLLALDKITNGKSTFANSRGQICRDDGKTITFCQWNLKDDNLDHQPEETKQFLIDLLTNRLETQKEVSNPVKE